MRNPLFAAAIAGATLTFVPAHAELTFEKVYDGQEGWLTEYIHNDDDPSTARNELADLCHIQGRITESEANFFDISIALENGLSAGVSFNSPQYHLQKGPLGVATIDIDGTKFTGPARGRKQVVLIDMSAEGFLRKLENGNTLVATLPGVTPDTWTFSGDQVDGALEALVKCVKDHIGKDAYALL